MTILSGRPHTALLVLSAQQGVLSGCLDPEPVVQRICSLVARARSVGTAVVWVHHTSDLFPEGSDAWQLRPEFVPLPGEQCLTKSFGDAFEDTGLEAVLAGAGVGRLVLCGALTDVCLRCTTHSALVRGYDVTLVADAHTTQDMRPYGSPLDARQAIDYLNACWEFTAAPGREAEVVDTDDVEFPPTSGAR